MGWKPGFAPPSERRSLVTVSPNPAATTHLPFFITAPGDTDVLFNIMVVFVVASIVLTGVIFLTIHSLPERMAHKSKKIQLDIVAVLCLLALFTHEHALWFAALLLAFIVVRHKPNERGGTNWRPYCICSPIACATQIACARPRSFMPARLSSE